MGTPSAGEGGGGAEAEQVAAVPGVGNGRRLVVGGEASGRWRGWGRGTIVRIPAILDFSLAKDGQRG